MIRRLLAALLITWALGFAWFAMALPRPAPPGRTDAAVVLTGGSGRVDRGLAALRNGWTRELLISGVDRNVRPHEFALQYKVNPALMACCVTLGYQALDTRSNAVETAAWLRRQQIHSVRVITHDWHMRRGVMALKRKAPAEVAIIEDAVASKPSLRMLFVEYHKFLAQALTGWLP